MHDGKNVAGSAGAPAAVIGGVVVFTRSTPGKEILTPLKPALVVEALRSGTGAPDSLNVIGLREALVHRILRETKQDGVSEVAVSERATNNKALERKSPNAMEAYWYKPPADPWSVEPRPLQPLSPCRLPPRPLPPDDLWSVEPRPLLSSYGDCPTDDVRPERTV